MPEVAALEVLVGRLDIAKFLVGEATVVVADSPRIERLGSDTFIKSGERLSFLYRHKTKDVVKNHTFDEGARLVREMLGSKFLSAHLFTSDEDLRIEFNRRGESRLAASAPTFSTNTSPRS